MTLAVRRGLVLTVIAVTDGEASHARSARIAPDELIARRLSEVYRAYAELGVSPSRVRLGLPDAGVTVQSLVKLLPSFLVDGCALLSPLPGDGHPDHDACGLAAASCAAEQGLPMFAYPVWAYHRGPGLNPDKATWRIDIPAEALDGKRRAMACFTSQLVALGPSPGDGPVLAPGFVEPFSRPVEVLYS